MNIEKLAKDIVKEVGGKENVDQLTHCVTRLRFRLNDDSIPDRAAIKSLDGIVGLVEQGGQFQIIIGTQVESVFAAVQSVLGDMENIVNKIEKTQINNPVKLLMGTIAEIFTPILGIMSTCGILLGLLNMMTAFHWLPVESAGYKVLYAIAHSFYFFMPVVLGTATAEKFKVNKYLGMIIGAALIYPTIIASAGTTESFFGIPMTFQNYSSTLFPVIITVYLASRIFKLVDKVTPHQLKLFVPALVSLLISVPVALLIIAPVVTVGGNIVTDLINQLYSFSPILCALALGGPWMILVMLGLHWAIIPIMISNIATVGFDYTLGLLVAGQFAFAASTFAIGFRTKNSNLKALAYSSGFTCLLGVSEPCMYGVLIPQKKAFVTAIVASSLASVFAAVFGTRSYVLGGSGIFSFPSYISPDGIGMGFYGAIFSVIAALILGFVLTYYFGFNKEEESINLNI